MWIIEFAETDKNKGFVTWTLTGWHFKMLNRSAVNIEQPVDPWPFMHILSISKTI